MDLLHVLGRTYPELALRVAQTLCFDLFDLHDREVALLSPLKLLVEEVEHCEVETPHIVATGQVHVVVGVEARKGNCAAEVGVLPLRYGLVFAVQVLLGEAEVDDVDLAVFAVEHKVGGFDIAMDETSLVDFFDGNDHFNENLNGDFQVVALLQTATRLGQVDAEQVHDDEVLLAILNVLVRVRNMLKACTLKI